MLHPVENLFFPKTIVYTKSTFLKIDLKTLWDSEKWQLDNLIHRHPVLIKSVWRMPDKIKILIKTGLRKSFFFFSKNQLEIKSVAFNRLCKVCEWINRHTTRHYLCQHKRIKREFDDAFFFNNSTFAIVNSVKGVWLVNKLPIK